MSGDQERTERLIRSYVQYNEGVLKIVNKLECHLELASSANTLVLIVQLNLMTFLRRINIVRGFNYVLI